MYLAKGFLFFNIKLYNDLTYPMTRMPVQEDAYQP